MKGIKITKTIWFKLMASFSVAILLGAFLTIVVIDAISSNRYKRHVLQSDLYRAQRMAPFFAAYYQENDGWNGVGVLFLSPGPTAGSHRQGMMRGGMMGMMSSVFRMVLTDTRQRIIADSASRQTVGTSLPGSAAKGIPVVSANRIVGYLFVGTMINGGISADDREFLSALRYGVLFSISLVFLLALAVTSVTVFWLTRPVKQLSKAAKTIASGNFQVRVPVKQQDELGSLSGSFNRMAAALEKDREWRHRMIDDSAHELRTPVSLIQANIEMMLEGIYPLDRKQLTSLQQETEKLTLLVNELQELSSMEAGSVPLKMETIALEELLQHLVNLYQPQAKKKKLVLELDPASIALSVQGDGQKINQAVSNLVSNALRETPARGKITLYCGKDPHKAGFCLISVSDTGPGIPEEERERVFERFFRLDASRNRKTGGTGLGLAIAREIVKQHRGAIGVKPSASGGACFFIQLPCEQ